MSNTPNAFIAYCEKYADDPALWVRDTWGIEPDAWQDEVLNAYGRGERLISIRSAHGVGKTAVVAWCSIHQLIFRYPQKIAATAPSRPQAFDAYFAEVKHWMNMLPVALQELFEMKADRIELKAARQSSFLSVRTSRADQPEALQGIHSKFVLLIGDEASGIPEPIFEAAVGSMSGGDPEKGERATTILIGNPVRTSGLFFDTHRRLKGAWFTMHVGYWPDAETRPAGMYHSTRITDAFSEEVAARYGRDSNAYRVRVLGEFPVTDDDSVIPFELIEEARARVVETHPEVREVWGLDVARFGGDRSVLCRRKGSKVTKLDVWKGLDLMQLTGQVHAAYNACHPMERPAAIYIDAIGMGAGVYDRLRELGLPVRAVNVSEAPSLKQAYRNQKAELWMNTKEWLQSKTASLPTNPNDREAPEEMLAVELGLPKYKFSSSGKMEVESKEEIKKRGFPSTDLADALVLTFADKGASLIYGSKSNNNWNEPLKRSIKGVS